MSIYIYVDIYIYTYISIYMYIVAGPPCSALSCARSSAPPAHTALPVSPPGRSSHWTRAGPAQRPGAFRLLVFLGRARVASLVVVDAEIKSIMSFNQEHHAPNDMMLLSEGSQRRQGRGRREARLVTGALVPPPRCCCAQDTRTLNPQPSTLNPQPSTLNPQHSTLNPQPSTLNPQPSTLNPQP